MIVNCLYFCDHRVVTRFISHSLSPCIYRLHLQLPVYHPLGIALRSRCLLFHGGTSNNRWNYPCGFLVTYRFASSVITEQYSTNKHKFTTSCFIFYLKTKKYIFTIVLSIGNNSCKYTSENRMMIRCIIMPQYRPKNNLKRNVHKIHMT